MSNIVLIGMSGAGKTTIGKYLAKKLNMTLVDTDDIIVKKQEALLMKYLIIVEKNILESWKRK